MGRSLHFTVEGEFITQLARERLFIEKDLRSAMNLIMSCTETDQLSNEEHLALCLQILNGDAWIKGRSGEDSYGVDYREDIDENPTDLGNIVQLLFDMKEENERLQKENNDLLYKFSMACGELSEIQLDKINAEWYNEYDEPMFSDRAVPEWRKTENQFGNVNMDSMLAGFLEQCRREDEAEKEGKTLDDYGWLSPDGEFFPVDFAEHAKWAQEWLNEHYPFRDHPKLYWMTDDNGTRHHIVNGDVLIYSLGWVLLDNPYRGPATPKKDPKRNFTSGQKEFLYDYYIERGRMEEANKLYED